VGGAYRPFRTAIYNLLTSLSRTCHGLWRNHLNMSRWFVSATFMICVRYCAGWKFRWKSA